MSRSSFIVIEKVREDTSILWTNQKLPKLTQAVKHLYIYTHGCWMYNCSKTQKNACKNEIAI
jgi:hypothetical protein